MRSRWMLVPIAVLALFVSAAAAQDKPDKHEAQLRTVHGSVIDQNENPVPSSVVYLKNTKTLVVKTYIADDSGHYRFSGLDPNVDYQIYAEHGDQRSATRAVSSFDERKDIEVILKLAKAKGK